MPFVTFGVHIREGCPTQEATCKISYVHVECGGRINSKSIFHVELLSRTITNGSPSTVVFILGFQEVEREASAGVCSIHYIHLFIHHLLGGLATTSVVITNNMNDRVNLAARKLTSVDMPSLDSVLEFSAVKGVPMMAVIRILVVIMSVLRSTLRTPTRCATTYTVLPISFLVLEFDVLRHIDDPFGCILVGSSCQLPLGFGLGLLRGSRPVEPRRR